MNFDKESKSEKKTFFFFCEGGGGVTDTKTVCKSQTVSVEVKYKLQLSTQYRASGTINISTYVNNFLSTKPITLILGSLVSEF